MIRFSLISLIVWIFAIINCPHAFSQTESKCYPDSISVSNPENQIITIEPQTIRYAPLWKHEGWFGSWDVHEGFNANVDLGVRVGWGKHNPWKGASFFTNINALYAIPLSKDGKWNAAFGGYYSNFKIWGDRKNSIGLMGLVDYQINDRLNAGIFATHDFGLLGNKSCLYSPIPWLDNPSTTIGANLGIKVNENLKFNVSMSFTRYHEQNNPFPQYPPQHSGARLGRESNAPNILTK